MKILIACGGTAGHIFPGLTLAEEIKREDRDCQIVMVVSSQPRDREYLMAGGQILKEVHIEAVGAIALPYKFSPKSILFAIKILLAFLKSFIIILKYAPQVAVGFGGYTSFAPLIIARLLGIPTLIHEQNFVPGRANRLLAKIADRIAISFEETDKFFSREESDHRIVKTGFPLCKHILDYKKGRSDRFTPFESKDSLVLEKFTVFVVGGSQGAHNINELVLNSLSLMDESRLTQMQVIHLTGKRDFHYVKARYAALGVNFWVFDFLEDMASAYSLADLLIARSGAGTIFEAANFGLPCIFIPYSYGTGHQKENALFLQRQGAALVLDEETSSCEDLERMLERLIDNKGMRENLSKKIMALKNPRASRNLKEQVIALYKGH